MVDPKTMKIIIDDVCAHIIFMPFLYQPIVSYLPET